MRFWEKNFEIPRTLKGRITQFWPRAELGHFDLLGQHSVTTFTITIQQYHTVRTFGAAISENDARHSTVKFSKLHALWLQITQFNHQPQILYQFLILLNQTGIAQCTFFPQQTFPYADQTH